MNTKIKKILQKSVATSLSAACCLTSIPALSSASTTLHQSCNLGEECPIPGNDGGQTVYNVTPANGMHYVCEVKSSSESLKFAVTSGKNFNIIKGNSIYNANPTATIEITGRFDSPNDPHAQGEIKFTRLPLSSSEGTVRCSPS